MKIIIAAILLLVITSHSFAQVVQDKTYYQLKVDKFTKMKKTGIALTVAGAILTGVGLGISLNSYISTTDDGYGNIETTTHGQPVLGAFTLLAGMGGLGAGIPLAIIGNKKQKSYQTRMNSLSLNINANPNRAGLILAYKF
jgi:hypothetical protein